MKTLSFVVTLACLITLGCAQSGKQPAAYGKKAATQAGEASKSAKTHPPVKVGPDIIVEKEIAKIWPIIIKVEDWGGWMNQVTKVEPGAGLSPGALIRWEWDEKAVESEIVSVKDNEEFAYKSSASTKKALVRWSLKSLGPKRTLISLRAEVPYGTASSIMDKLGVEMSAWIMAMQAEAARIK